MKMRIMKDDEIDDSEEEEEEDNTDTDDDAGHFLATVESPKMWVQRSKHSSNNEDEEDALWVLIGDDNDNENENEDEKHKNKKRQQTKKDNNNIRLAGAVLKLTFDDETDDWVAKKATPKEESELFVRDDGWIPIEGLYGTHRVPSGVLWILITGTEATYEAPPIMSSSTSTSSPQPWWQIRRVTNLEIVHLGNKGYHQPETSAAVVSA